MPDKTPSDNWKCMYPIWSGGIPIVPVFTNDQVEQSTDLRAMRDEGWLIPVTPDCPHSERNSQGECRACGRLEFSAGEVATIGRTAWAKPKTDETLTLYFETVPGHEPLTLDLGHGHARELMLDIARILHADELEPETPPRSREVDRRAMEAERREWLRASVGHDREFIHFAWAQLCDLAGIFELAALEGWVAIELMRGLAIEFERRGYPPPEDLASHIRDYHELEPEDPQP